MAVPLDRPGVLATLSALRLVQGRAEQALAAAEDAVSRCQTMGGCGLFRGAFVRLAHARLLTIAARIAEPSYRASFLEHVPENARTLALVRAWPGDAAPSA